MSALLESGLIDHYLISGLDSRSHLFTDAALVRNSYLSLVAWVRDRSKDLPGAGPALYNLIFPHYGVYQMGDVYARS